MPAGPSTIALNDRLARLEGQVSLALSAAQAAQAASGGEHYVQPQVHISPTGEVSSQPLRILNGTLLGAGVKVPPEAHEVDVRDGTEESPAHIGVTASVSRTDATTRAEVNAMGPVGTDGPDGASALRAATFGTKASQVQVCGVVARVTQEGSENGGEGSPDACALYGRAVVQETGIGHAIGAYLEASRETAKGGGGQAIELRIKNVAGAASAYVANGPSALMGQWMNAQGAAGTVGCAIQIGHGFAQQFDVGLGINEGSIASAAFRDDSEALRGIYMTKPHAKAAIAIAQGAGPVIIGGNETATASVRLEVNGAAETQNPLVDVGSGANNNVYSIRIRNVSGNAVLFASAGANNVLTGTAQGDTGIAFTAAKIFHIGAVGTTSMLRIAENKVGLYGVAPIARQTKVTAPAETLASLKLKVEELSTRLTNIGITE